MIETGKIQEYTARLLASRIRILDDYGFYGLLLMHLIFAIDEECGTAATDGVRVYFGPRFLESLADDELDIVLMHELLHVVLEHVFRGARLPGQNRFNLACDIVVNSNIMRERNLITPIVLREYGELMYLAPNGHEGHLHTAEEVYAMLPPEKEIAVRGRAQGGAQSKKAEIFADDHSRWGMAEDAALREVWIKNIFEAAEAITVQNAIKSRGTLPAFAERLIQRLKNPQTDWRAILNDFVQEEINDYSFSPPDKRFECTEENPFFLPDFNEKDDAVKDILFMIDTSGSMSDEEITAAFSEIHGAIQQFNGKLAGMLGFFDAAITPPVPFESVQDLKNIRPIGGGGTDFHIIFEYVAANMEDSLPSCVIILTDGFAPFPPEEMALGVPVLWLINNEEIDPPWGRVARIKV
jgi:predicted metal-dependent peptidase